MHHRKHVTWSLPTVVWCHRGHGKHSFLYCCVLDRVYRAVAWQRVDQICYNINIPAVVLQMSIRKYTVRRNSYKIRKELLKTEYQSSSANINGRIDEDCDVRPKDGVFFVHVTGIGQDVNLRRQSCTQNTLTYGVTMESNGYWIASRWYTPLQAMQIWMASIRFLATRSRLLLWVFRRAKNNGLLQL
jgi:hypothetical protein